MIWLLILFLVYVGILVLALRVSIYPVRTPVFISPGAIGAPQEEVEFESDDGTLLRGWFVEHTNPRGMAVLIHGYLMNRSELTPLAAWLHEQGWSSLVIDLRAHGKSRGRKSTFGVREKMDVRAAAEFARRKVGDRPIILVGSSMGSAACAFALADDHRLADGLVLDSGYSQLPAAVLGWWYFLGGKPLKLLLAPTVYIAAPFVGFDPFKVDVAKALEVIPHPILIVHGDADTLASPSQAERNFDACASRAELVWFAGAGHSEGRWMYPDKYYEAVGLFLDRVLSEKSVVAKELTA